MGDTLHVFISATGGDLGTVRELVKQGLLTMRCTPVEQTNFPPGYRAVAAMLEERIRGCEAVIHLVGLRYGAEPEPASLPAGAARRSFTQMEADLARKLGKKLYVFVCPEDFPYDAHEPEPEELAALQRAYREEIAARPTLRTPVADRTEVARRVRELQLDLDRMRARLARQRRRTFAPAAGFALLLLGLAALDEWNLRRTPEVMRQTADATAQKAVALQEGAFDRERIRANLNAQLKNDAAAKIAQLDRALDWEKIAAIERERGRQLADINRCLDGMEQAYVKHEVSANYIAASRLLAERGPAEALRFLEARGGERDKKLEVLRFAKDRAEGAIRKLLREKFLAASLLEKDAERDQAEAEYRSILRDGGTWAEPRNKLAGLLYERGIAVDSVEGNQELREAAELCHGTLAAHSREADPRSWAHTQMLLGLALWGQGTRASGAESLRLLGEAVAACRAALEINTRAPWPQDWAMTQMNLGLALRAHGARASGAESERLLGEAVAAYRAALEVTTREQAPQDWATTQNSLGNALRDQGSRASGAESERLLGEAVAAYRAALEVTTRAQWPQDWARTQMNLGAALADQGMRASGPESQRLLREAVAACRAALEVYTRERSPQDWARTQNNLGLALQTQGKRAEEGLRLLSEAVTAYRAALEERPRQQWPQAWAITQNNLGIVLTDQGERAEGAESRRLIGEAVAAFRANLEVHTREQLPDLWRSTQSNLATALHALAEHSEGAEAAKLRAEAEAIDKELAAAL